MCTGARITLFLGNEGVLSASEGDEEYFTGEAESIYYRGC